MFNSMSHKLVGKAATIGVAALSLAAATVASIEPASAFRGGFGGGHMYVPHGGGGFGHGGYGRGYGGGYGRGYGGYGHRGYGYGLGGLGLGLALGGAYGLGYGGYGGGYGGYYGAGYGGYGGYGYGGCVRRVYGPFGPHLVNVCY